MLKMIAFKEQIKKPGVLYSGYALLFSILLVHVITVSLQYMNVWNIYWVAVDNLWNDHNVYLKDQRASDLFKYSPFFLFLISPVYWLPQALGKLVWNVINLGFLFASAFFLVRWEHPSGNLKIHWLVILAFLLLLEVINLNFITGQSNVLILFLIILGFEFEIKRKPWMAGLCFAISALTKIFPILFVFYFLLRRRFYTVGAILLFVAILTLVPFVFKSFAYTSELYISWYDLLRHDMANPPMKLSLYALLSSYFGAETTPLQGEDIVELASLSKQSIQVIWWVIVISYAGWLGYVIYQNRQKEHKECILYELSPIMMAILLFSHMTEGPTRIYLLPVYFFILTKIKSKWLLVGFFMVILFQSIGSDLLGESSRWFFHIGHWNLGLVFIAFITTYLVQKDLSKY